MQAFMIFLLGIGAGALFEITLSFTEELLDGKPLRINHRFTLTKRISLVTLPLWGLLALIITENYTHARLFLASAAIGPLFEFSAGQFFYRVFGAKIWTYHFGALGQFTSIYSVPYWGAGGLLFYVVAKLLAI